MKITESPLPGLLIIEPSVFSDERGYFYESYHFQRYQKIGIEIPFVQDNESKSVRGVIRGLHYQLNPFAQAKLVRVVQGTVYDVALDLRKGSPTFGQYYGLVIGEKDKKQLFIPRGFAHGFSVLSETAIFSYKCDNAYSREHERAINAFDPQLAIDWQFNEHEWKVSDKDMVASLFAQAEMNFIF
ncbi:MAG: dTDP-4-dehydrorhamnose 3 [Prolixibacteraceae bacterium]|nr:MAG: dTDP-4-dehydrorhamnose 3 [Prolixibacteraceae bacterium]